MFIIVPLYSIANPTVNLTLIANINAITVMWIPLSFSPQTYQLGYSCRSLCTKNVSNSSILSVKPPQHTITGLSPGSYCVFNLFGKYGSDQHQLDSRSAITLSSGKV